MSGPSGPGADPRLDPRLHAVLRATGAEAAAPDPTVSRDSEPHLVAAELAAIENGFADYYSQLEVGPDGPRVSCVDETALSSTGRPVGLRIFRPEDESRPLPCVVYLHGGGMTVHRTSSPIYQRWCLDLAAAGLVVVLVDFENAWSPDGPAPFPAGLDDCTAALAWVDARRDELGVTSVVLQGESGGANLCAATALGAKQQGWVSSIDGVYLVVPYLSGGYGWPPSRKSASLPSLLENDGYFVSCAALDLMVAMYDPGGRHAEDPLCWPWFARQQDLAGLPPHVVVVNELDPLRDEGIDYYRRLGRAGVSVVGRLNLGLVHGAELIFRSALSAHYFATVADVGQFARSVSPG